MNWRQWKRKETLSNVSVMPVGYGGVIGTGEVREESSDL